MKIKKSSNLKGKKLLILITGSIAAVKVPLLISNLIKEGAQIKCVISPSATRLVSPLSVSTLSRHRCYQDEDQWNPNESKPLHIALNEWADLVLIAPLSASSLARWVHGLAEGLIASLLCACEKTIIAAPAMNTGMWSNQGVKANWLQIQKYPNVLTLEPSEGLLACDRTGEGKMAAIDVIEIAIQSVLIQLKKHGCLKKDWKGYKLLITAGPTVEDIDSARYLTNRSSGQMGVFLAQAAKFRGGEIDFIHGPLQVSSNLLEGLNNFQIRNANDMSKIINDLQPYADAIIMSAAISDLKAKTLVENRKLKKQILIESLTNNLELVPDLLSSLTQKSKPNQVTLGFSALTGTDEEIQEAGLSKKNIKGCDLLFANPIDRPNQGFEENLNQGWLIGPVNRVVSIPLDSKLSIAHLLLDELMQLIQK